MSEKEYDPFAGESGLRDDWDGIVEDAWFAINAQFQGLMCYLRVRDLEAGDEVELRYSTGPDWGSFDGGETAEHPKGEMKGFNNQTAYYAFISAAMEAGAEEELRRRSSEQFGGKGPKAAALWKGLSFHFEVATEKRSVPDNDNPGQRKDIEISRTLPVKFLGVGETSGSAGGQGNSGAVAPPSPASTAPAPETSPVENATPPVTPPPTGGALADLPAEMAAQVKVLAATNTYPDWVDAVMALPNALTHASLVSELGNESFYQSLRA